MWLSTPQWRHSSITRELRRRTGTGGAATATDAATAADAVDPPGVAAAAGPPGRVDAENVDADTSAVAPPPPRGPAPTPR